MTFREVLLSIDGLRERDRMIEAWHRRSAFIIASTNFGGKGVANRMDKLWPVKKEKADLSSARKLLAHFKEIEKQRNARTGA